MAIGDFMHKQLINAASRDALSTIGAGAAVGGGAGAVNGLLSDNDTMIGGAISGAMLGAGAGAGLRYAGNKYGAGILAEAKAGNEPGKFSANLFTKAGKDEGLDFFGDHSAAMAVHREAANKTANAAPSAGSAVAQEVNQAGKAGEPPVAGPVSSRNISREAQEMVNEGNAKDVIQATKKLREEQKASATSYAGAELLGGSKSKTKGYNGTKRAAQKEAQKKSESLLANRKPTPGIQDQEDAGFMGDVPAWKLASLNNTYAPKLNPQEIQKGVIAKNASKIQKPGYTSQQEINSQWDSRAVQKDAQMEAMWESIGR